MPNLVHCPFYLLHSLWTKNALQVLKCLKKPKRIFYNSYKLYEIKFQCPQINLYWNTHTQNQFSKADFLIKSSLGLRFSTQAKYNSLNHHQISHPSPALYLLFSLGSFRYRPSTQLCWLAGFLCVLFYRLLVYFVDMFYILSICCIETSF